MVHREQLELAKKHHLPLFLHSRACHQDFVEILTEAGMHENGGEAVGGKGGVAHSYTGPINEMEEMVSGLLTLSFRD
jgi:TatD DNase family protein